jgi:arginine deiminase
MADKIIGGAAYGGDGWSPRNRSLKQEMGRIWTRCGQSNEWGLLKAVLLHKPGPELNKSANPEAVQMLAPMDPVRAREQHATLVKCYQDQNVSVHLVNPGKSTLPNQMFVADLLFMTPEGAIITRPASTARAGEERFVARRLADLGIPILRTISGKATFEGADAAWLDAFTVLIGRGLRTNSEGIMQVSNVLAEMGVEVIVVDLPAGTMHLMGMLRFADQNLALAWPRRLAYKAVQALEKRGYQVVYIPDEVEATNGFALNFVTLGPRHILMPAANPVTREFYELLGITCITVEVDELVKAAGAVGCLTGVLERAEA